MNNEMYVITMDGDYFVGSIVYSRAGFSPSITFARLYRNMKDARGMVTTLLRELKYHKANSELIIKIVKLELM